MQAWYKKFSSQPHQPFFVSGILFFILFMMLFTASYSNILTLDNSVFSFHAYPMVFVIFIQFFLGFLFVVFPRFLIQAEIQIQETMEVVSTREFRANQKKYFGMANKGEDIILKSRNWGSFRLVPISQNDIVTNKPDLTERICQAIREVKLMREGKIKELSMDELLDEL